jgi:hypothetical protein
MVQRSGGSKSEAEHTATSPYSKWPKGTPRPVPWPEVQRQSRKNAADKLVAMEEVFQRDGIRHRLILMPDGRIIDGHQRVAMAERLGLSLPLADVMPEGTTDEQGLLLARGLQLARRNLSQSEWMQGRAAEQEMHLALRKQGMTQARAAEKIGIPRATGQSWEHR